MTDTLPTKPLPDALKAAEDLPTLPMVAVEVLRLCRDEETTLDDLAATLSRDPALAARLLRFANSSLYNLGHEVTNLQRAALVLGMKTVQLMSLGFSLATSLPRGGEVKAFDYAVYWRRSLACAVAGRSMSCLVGSMTEDEAFLCGLLGEIGQMAIVQCMPDEYGDVLEEAGNRWPTLEVEQRVLGFDHADVGMAILDSWELPALISGTVGYMLRPDELPADLDVNRRTLARVMHLASLTVDLLTSHSKGDALTALEERGKEYFDLTAESIYAFITSLESGIRETSEMLNVTAPATATHEEILEEARNQMLNIGVDTARELEHTRRVTDLVHRAKILEDPLLRDEFTGIPNQLAFERFLDHEIRARIAKTVSQPLGLVLVRIDGFRKFRDRHGGAMGDAALREAGSTVGTLVRRGDLPTRIGTRSFAVILSQATPEGLGVLAKRLSEGIAARRVDTASGPVGVTASVGGACLGSVRSRADGPKLYTFVRGLLRKARKKGPGGIEVQGKTVTLDS